MAKPRIPVATTPIRQVINIGPVCGAELESVGIRTYGDFEKLGWEKTIAVYTRAHPHRLNNIVCWGLLGALLNIPHQQMPEELKEKGKALCAKLKKERR
jgi:hypothetical protein